MSIYTLYTSLNNKNLKSQFSKNNTIYDVENTKRLSPYEDQAKLECFASDYRAREFWPTQI